MALPPSTIYRPAPGYDEKGNPVDNKKSPGGPRKLSLLQVEKLLGFSLSSHKEGESSWKKCRRCGKKFRLPGFPMHASRCNPSWVKKDMLKMHEDKDMRRCPCGSSVHKLGFSMHLKHCDKIGPEDSRDPEDYICRCRYCRLTFGDKPTMETHQKSCGKLPSTRKKKRKTPRFCKDLNNFLSENTAVIDSIVEKFY